VLTALNAAQNPEPLKYEGTLADACRVVLKSATVPLAPTEVRDGVLSIGFELSTAIKHDNPMASIHSVLKRFEDAEDVERTKDKKYRWIGRGETRKATPPTPTALSTISAPLMDFPITTGIGIDAFNALVGNSALEAFSQHEAQWKKLLDSVGKVPEGIASHLEQLEKTNARMLASLDPTTLKALGIDPTKK
jgi:hypothetical protein